MDFKEIEILLVEDNEDDIYFINKSLKEFNYKIKILKNGYEAVNYLTSPKNSLPDVLLLDNHLPFLNGTEVIKKLRDVEIRIPYIILSSDTNIDLILESIRDGASDFIPKYPKYLQRLPAIIEKAHRNNLMQIEKKEFQRRLIESEERFSRIFNKVKDLIFRYSFKTEKFEYVSSAAYDIFGLEPEELYLRPHLMLEAFIDKSLNNEFKKCLIFYF